MQITKLQSNQIFLVRVIFLAIILSLIMYVYLINTISFSLANRQRVSELVSVRQSEIGDLEMELLATRRFIDLKIAEEFGLSKSVVNDALVVVRDGESRLTLNE